MEYTKDDLRKKFNEVIEQAEKKGYLTLSDARSLVQNGIPVHEICRSKEFFDVFRNRFEKWLKSL